jgi:hypothetical protein
MFKGWFAVHTLNVCLYTGGIFRVHRQPWFACNVGDRLAWHRRYFPSAVFVEVGMATGLVGAVFRMGIIVLSEHL